ncbi:hypothetical protein AURDEDRAFT_164047 [Auricularia subglabra TFB-10046 SS5]|nr:hypothetical protein AURDEDRAFT_164047 [Auricularia subglabra TFB-10046 SS5]
MGARSVLSLPAELTDRFIDFVAYDRRDLPACALTCKAWRNRSQYNLFHSIQVVSRPTHDTRAVQLHRRAVLQFVRTVPRLTSFIAHLHITRWATSPDSTWVELLLDCDLRSLRQISVEGTIAARALMLHAAGAVALNNLRMLQLIDVNYERPNLFTENIRLFRGLRTFHAKVTFDDDEPPVAALCLPTFCDCVVRVWVPYHQALGHWIAKSIGQIAAIELVVRWVTEASLEALTGLPARIKNVVKHVILPGLVTSELFYTDDLGSRLSNTLSAFPVLSLSVDFDMSSPTTVAHAVPRLAALLDSHAAPIVPRLQALNLRFSGFPPGSSVVAELECSDWQVLDDALAARQELKRLTLHLDIGAPELGALAEVVGRHLRTSLPVLSRLGCLEVLLGNL